MRVTNCCKSVKDWWKYIFPVARSILAIVTIIAGWQESLMSWFLWPLFVYFLALACEKQVYSIDIDKQKLILQCTEQPLWVFAFVLILAGDEWQQPIGVCRALSLLVIVVYIIPLLYEHCLAVNRAQREQREQQLIAAVQFITFIFAVVLAAGDWRIGKAYIVFGCVLLVTSFVQLFCTHWPHTHTVEPDIPLILQWVVTMYALLLLAGGDTWQQAPGACRVLAVLVVVELLWVYAATGSSQSAPPADNSLSATLPPGAAVYPSAPPVSLKYAVTL